MTNLLARGADVRALVRGSSKDTLPTHPRLTPYVGDLTDGVAALQPLQQPAMLALRNEVEAASGRRWNLVRKGTLRDLRAEIARRQFTASSMFEYPALQYQIAMLDGTASLRDVRNADYPDVLPTPVAAYLAGPGAAHFAVPEKTWRQDEWPTAP
ncbi:hypothetical protein AWW66_12215 [Micromonospora rosaria]|uniref:Uncharacterized protein n=1 Tax=Micromonospora rosaria TaxID=47874 RepID=A0A136PU59_9ACTN|nr:hypothetical protein AWW66_12215 [Micromonospora rosaria]